MKLWNNAVSGIQNLAQVGERRVVFCIFCASVFVQMVMLYLLPISVSNDSWGYLALAGNLFDKHVSFERTVGYPYFIAISGVRIFDSLVGLIYIQSLIAISLPLLAYFTLRPLGRGLSLLAAVISLFCLHAYFMSLQVLTELSFMFSIAVFAFFASRYFYTNSWFFLTATVVSTFGIMLIRVSGAVQFASFLIGMAVLLTFEFFRTRRFSMKILKQGVVGVVLFAGFNVTYAFMTDRTATVVLPHFVFNWVYRGGTDVNYGVVHPDNGPKTKTLFAAIGEVLQTDPAGYRQLATVASEPVRQIAESKPDYSKEDVKFLVDDLISNNTHNLRSWWIEGVLVGKFGVKKTMTLLRGAILEAFVAHPEIIWRRLHQSVSIMGVAITKPPTTSSIYVGTFWQQVPSPGLVSFIGEFTPGVFSIWMRGMDALTGSDDESRQQFGRFPSSWEEAWRFYSEYGNSTAMGKYLTMASMNLARPVLLMMILGLFFGFWSKYPGLALTAVLAGTVPPIISVFLSETDSRHILMSYPVQIVAAVMALEGAINFIARLGAITRSFGRRRLVRD